MTDIPGTGKVSPIPAKKEFIPRPESISVVNVDELKKVSEGNILPKKELKWHQKLIGWTIFGSIAGILFILLSFIASKKLIYLAPLGPIVGIVGWHVKKYASIFEKKNKLL